MRRSVYQIVDNDIPTCIFNYATTDYVLYLFLIIIIEGCKLYLVKLLPSI